MLSLFLSLVSDNDDLSNGLDVDQPLSFHLSYVGLTTCARAKPTGRRAQGKILNVSITV